MLLLLIADLILVYITNVKSNNVHYITTSPMIQCPEESCLTLSTAVANSIEYFDSNSTIIFLEGSHVLDSNLIVSNIHGSLMLTTNASSFVAIFCDGKGSYSMEFHRITRLQISGLEFFGCGSKVELVDQFILEDSKFHGGSNSALHLNHSNTSILQSSFVSNTVGTYQVRVEVLAFMRSIHLEFPFNGIPYIQSTGARVGGAFVVTSSTVNIIGSSFESNSAEVGGAIYSQLGSDIYINNCTFVNNSVTGCSDDGCIGGAMFIDTGGFVIVYNSTFMKNNAQYSGGAIALFQETYFDSTYSLFNGNRGGTLGGALCAYNRNRITINNDCYSNNTASYGGAIYIHRYCGVTMGKKSTFDSNEASSDGGVIYAYYLSSITVNELFFDKNKAGTDGGVIYASSSSSITLSNSSFSTNEAGSNGGVLYVHSSSCITVNSSYFDYNGADNGGVIYSYSSSSITVDNACFVCNEASYGGVVYVAYSSRIAMGNSSFDNNEAVHNGGVVYASSSSSVTVGNSSFGKNDAGSDGGVLYLMDISSLSVGRSSFHDNTAGHDGGAVYAYFNNISVINFRNYCTFFNNSATEGGVVYLYKANFSDTHSMYYGNMASNGGAIVLTEGIVKVTGCEFMNNAGGYAGGVLYIPLHDYEQVITLEICSFINNSATSGGAIAAFSTATVTVTKSFFAHNYAIRGGAIYILVRNNLFVSYSNFSHNMVITNGGIIFSENQNRLNFNNCKITENVAGNHGGAICLLFQSELNITGDNHFSENQAFSGGVIYASESTITIHSQTSLMANNTAVETGGAICLSVSILTFIDGSNCLIQNQAQSGGVLYATKSRIEIHSETMLIANNTARGTGGAVYLFKANLTLLSNYSEFVGNKAITGGATYLEDSQLIFSNGNVMLISNKAVNGGAVFVSVSNLIIESDSQIKVSANSAAHNGGGLYLTMSELTIRGESLNITRNRANNQGGGIHATNSLMIIEETAYIVSNEARDGGGISLERSARLYGASDQNDPIINFVRNRASKYGGALYVNDKTNPDMCVALSIQSATSTSKECFSNLVYINLSDNFAGVLGSNLFGGLLDRCIVNNEVSNQRLVNESGITSFLNLSNIDESQLLGTVTSHPVRLCFCRDGQPDCNHQPQSIRVNRGKIFSIELIAYDQVQFPINASIQCSLNSSAGGLGEGEIIQSLDKACTELKYNLFTPNDHEELIFLAMRSPCNQSSIKSIMIEIICSCPIGFQISDNDEISCDCVCDQVIQLYQKTKCNSATESIIRRENFWISYVNHTWSNLSGYIIYSYCPYDYCFTPDKEISINLNLLNGSDAQCNSNRMGTLCGTCKPGLSVSLGSSKCVLCPIYWPGLLVTVVIVFIISGIGLVAFLLSLNLTVAMGTLNGIIFYANILAANKSVLFPSGVGFASVFISWLNFDFGIDACFFDGMDMYVKIWLQLAFPVYIIILVVVIVQLSYHFDTFGRYIGKKDPVATLATLILLSYAKLLQTIITAFSSATLDYPGGSKRILWLPDATIDFFTSKHAVLFFTAVLILVAGLVYTFLLFSWQWFLYCPRQRVKWIRNQKLCSFMEVYHIPYVPKYRYWTGLLLLARVGIYLVSAFNPSGDPRLTLLATTLIISGIIFYIAILGIRIYKNHIVNIMETLTYSNIVALTIFTWYIIDTNINQSGITNVSVGITLIQLVGVIIYHIDKYMNQARFKDKLNIIFITMKKKLTNEKQKQVNHKTLPKFNEVDNHQLCELLDIFDHATYTNGDNMDMPQVQPKPAERFRSVTELAKPIHASSSTLPCLDLIKKELELSESKEQVNVQDTPVMQNLGAIETAECESTSTNPAGTKMVQKGVGPHCVIVKAEIHDY